MRLWISSSNLLTWWLRMLGLPRQSSPTWHRERLRDELQERRAARTRIQTLSESSDVLFALVRARHDGFGFRSPPRFVVSRRIPVYTYMVSKYTLRWGFYLAAAAICTSPRRTLVREVVNPSKDEKLVEVASRHHIDPDQFKRVGRRLRWIWPLLPWRNTPGPQEQYSTREARNERLKHAKRQIWSHRGLILGQPTAERIVIVVSLLQMQG